MSDDDKFNMIASECIKSCNMEQLFRSTKQFARAPLSHLTRALIRVCTAYAASVGMGVRNPPASEAQSVGQIVDEEVRIVIVHWP